MKRFHSNAPCSALKSFLYDQPMFCYADGDRRAHRAPFSTEVYQYSRHLLAPHALLGDVELPAVALPPKHRLLGSRRCDGEPTGQTGTVTYEIGQIGVNDFIPALDGKAVTLFL